MDREHAIGSDAVKSGVVNAPGYEDLAARMHGYGQRHACQDPNCPRCTKSSPPPPAELRNARETDTPPNPDLRGPSPYDPAITGNPDEALAGIDAAEERREASVPLEVIMQEHPGGKPAGGSSKSSKGQPTADAIRGKTDIPTCIDCHLQHRRGTACPSGLKRPEILSGRVSESVRKYVQSGGADASAGEIVEAVVGVMIAANCTLATIQNALEAWMHDSEEPAA